MDLYSFHKACAPVYTGLRYVYLCSVLLSALLSFKFTTTSWHIRRHTSTYATERIYIHRSVGIGQSQTHLLMISDYWYQVCVINTPSSAAGATQNPKLGAHTMKLKNKTNLHAYISYTYSTSTCKHVLTCVCVVGKVCTKRSATCHYPNDHSRLTDRNTLAGVKDREWDAAFSWRKYEIYKNIEFSKTNT